MIRIFLIARDKINKSEQLHNFIYHFDFHFFFVQSNRIQSVTAALMSKNDNSSLILGHISYEYRFIFAQIF